MLYPSRSTDPFVAIPFSSFSLSLFLSLSLSSPHHSFMSFRIGNNARFNVNIERGEYRWWTGSYDERAFIRFAKIIQNRFFDDGGVESWLVGWLVGWSRVVIIDYRYIVDILIDIVLGTSVISFKISYDVIEIIIIGILQNGASARKLKISNQLFCNCFITCTTLFLLILLVLLLKKKKNQSK